MQPLSGNLRPDLLTSLMNMSLVPRLPGEMHLSRSSSNIPRLPSFLEMPQNQHVLLTFGKVQNPLRLPRKATSEPSKVVRARGAFNIFTWNRALRHNCVHFFDMSTSKSAPRIVSFVHFDFEMCFVPQHSTLFQHLNFQKFSEPIIFFYTFDFDMCFAPQRRALFWAFQPKSAPKLRCLYILTSKCASRQNGVQFFISHLARWVRTPL